MTLTYKNMSTRQLLARLRGTRKMASRGPNWGDAPWEPTVYAKLDQEAAALKSELATREHVPSRLEGTLSRRITARQNRGQGKSKNR